MMDDIDMAEFIYNVSAKKNMTWYPHLGISQWMLHTTKASLNETTASSTYPQIDGAIDNIYVQLVFMFFYSSIFLIGITGNILVCYVVCRNKAMHTVTNFFIANLAVSDIMLCVLAVPFTPMYTFFKRWIFGRVMCHLVSCAQAVSVYISSLTLMTIAFDRFIVIMYPFRHRMKVSTCVMLISTCWILSVLLTVPYALFVRMDTDEKTNNSYCEEDWPSERYRLIFGTITLFLQFILPFLIIAVCYTVISIKLNDRAKTKPGSKSAKKEEADRERKKRTNIMLISMVLVFAICWLPLCGINFINDFYEMQGGFTLVVFFVFHCLAMSSTCYNPFLYAWLNENFRKEFKQVLPFIRRPGGYNGVYGAEYSRAVSQSDRLQSQMECHLVRAKEIIPRGPTFNSSIKKNLTAGGGGVTVNNQEPLTGAAVQQKQSHIYKNGVCEDVVTQSTVLIETNFDCIQTCSD